MHNFNYSQPGYYFVTWRTKDGAEWFGCVNDGRMLFNKLGGTAHILWQTVHIYYPNIRLDAFVIMPNHIHAIIEILPSVRAELHSALTAPTGPVGRATATATVGTECDSVPTDTGITKSGKHYGLISKIIKSFKHDFTKTIRGLYGNYQFRWKRSFHDRIIRDERELKIKRNYVENNPANWWRDRNNKSRVRSSPPMPRPHSVRAELHSALTAPTGPVGHAAAIACPVKVDGCTLPRP